jgi:hypothetical protein
MLAMGKVGLPVSDASSSMPAIGLHASRPKLTRSAHPAVMPAPFMIGISGLLQGGKRFWRLLLARKNLASELGESRPRGRIA